MKCSAVNFRCINVLYYGWFTGIFINFIDGEVIFSTKNFFIVSLSSSIDSIREIKKAAVPVNMYCSYK
jgi:hypothetical protein